MHNLRQFLDILQREGELVRIETPVSSDLEIAEIHRRVIAAAGPALLFENVEGADFPCVTNLFGTKKRVDWAFGSRPEQFINQLVQLAQDLPSLSPSKLCPHKNLVSAALKLGMKTSAKGPIPQHVQTPPDLSRLPFLKTWPEDGGHFITLPLVYTQHPDTGHHNLGMYRIQRHDAQPLGVHWQIQKGGGFHYHIAEQRDEPFPLVIFVGGPPALMLSAIAPLPEGPARANPGLPAARRAPTARDKPPWRPIVNRRSRVHPGHRAAARAPTRRPLRRPLRLLLAATRLPHTAGQPSLPPQRRSIIVDRSGQTAARRHVPRHLHTGADGAPEQTGNAGD